jgi:hypothetical protein
MRAIESKVHEYVPNQRLGWYGYAPGRRFGLYSAEAPRRGKF